MALAAALMVTACDSGDPMLRKHAASGPFAETWETETPSRFSFPPVGLEDFAHDIEHAGALEVVLYLDRDGQLLEAQAKNPSGLSETEIDTILASFRRARFEPARVKGQQVASIKRIALNFDPNARFTIDPDPIARQSR